MTMERVVPGIALVRAASRLVPAAHRDAWVAEWHGELHWRWTAGRRRDEGSLALRLALVARCVGAVPDALWMRHRHGGGFMFSQDVRLALRSIRARPGFSAVVVGTLALAIGANAAIFSVVNGVLLRALPFHDPDRLVLVRGAPTDGDSAKVGGSTSYPDYADLRDAAKAFQSIAILGTRSPVHTSGKLEPARLSSAVVSANFFSTLGVAPLLGRGFLAEEDTPGGPKVAVLAHELWQSRFGGDPRILGTSITLDGQPHTIVGVMPRGFAFPRTAQLFTPITQQPRIGNRGVHGFTVIGRIAAGVPFARAEAEAKAIAARLEAEHPESNAKRGARLEPMREAVVHNARPGILVLAGAVGLVLIIGCTNVAGLFLARAASREREAAVRTALGAARGRLVRQLLTESVLLSLIGGALGIVVALYGVRALVASAPSTLPRTGAIAIDGIVLTYLLLVSVAVGVAFGALPAWQFSRGESLAALRDGGRGATSGKRRLRLRRVLVASELALAVVLVVGAGLLVKSFARLQQVDVRFDPTHLLLVPIELPESRYGDAQLRGRFYESLRERTEALPGVRGAAIAQEHPLGEGWTSSFTIVGHEPPKPGEEPESRIRPISAGYFHLMGVPLRAGREFAAQDRQGSPGVVVINEAFAAQHFPNENPIGKHIHRSSWWPGMPDDFEVIGVAANERFRGLENEADPATYFSLPQFQMAQYLLLRTQGDPLALLPAVRREIWALDRSLPVEGANAMTTVLDEQLAGARFNTGLLTLFAVVALFLAALGVYGVLSYSVTQRTSEIGLRMALGAPRASVVRLVVQDGLSLATIGIAVGVGGALVATRLLTKLLFGVSPLDPQVFAVVMLLLGTVATLAAYLPARRASRVDPMVAMRSD